MRPRPLLVALSCLAGFGMSAGQLHAEIGDLTLQTDHPLYPGEGAFQTPADCVHWATRDTSSPQERSLAIFNWLLTHQWHLASPQEWYVPGRKPGDSSSPDDLVVFDANRGRFSYGYGLCGTVHAWNEAYWRAAGFEARRRAFPGHSNSEVLVDGHWKMFDTDMAGIVFDRTGRVVGYDEIAADLSLLEEPQQGWPRYPFAWPSDFDVMKKGWEQVATGGNWYKLYHGGYAAQPGVVHLRSGESFTRYAHPDGFGGPDQRRFWHIQPGGPARLWTFANSEKPFHDGPESNSRGRTRYGNAHFVYAPNLTQATCREGIISQSQNLSITQHGLASANDKPATVTFFHWSPYVLCGRPVDGKDPVQGKATDGLIVSGAATAPLQVEVSSNQGQTWSQSRDTGKDFKLDLTEQVKGRYGWSIRITIPPGATLRSIRFETTGQLNETMYPRLTGNGSHVTYRAARRAVIPVIPWLVDEQETIDRFEVRELRSDNLDFVGRSTDQRLAYNVRGPKPASVVFRIPSETPLVGLAAAARYSVRSPSPPEATFQLHYSLDQGQTWTELGSSTPPTDNEYSSGWVYGTAEFPPTHTSEAYIRVHLDGGGYGTGLQRVELYGLRETSRPSAATLTYSWFEGTDHPTETVRIAAGLDELTATIPTGNDIRDDFVRIAVD